MIYGWFDNYQTNLGVQMSPKENIGTTFRISGKPNLTRPLIILGNSIRVEFSSSASAKYFFNMF